VNVCLLLLLVIFVSAVLGLQLFSGLFYSCNDGSVAGVEECTGFFTDATGAQITRVWSRPFYNFDSFGDR
jgi:voltage-dependent calcium channel